MLRLISITLLFAFSLGNALTHQAKSGSRDDVQAAINKAQIGDTVFIPAGNFVFNGGVSLKGGITIMGAGEIKPLFDAPLQAAPTCSPLAPMEDS